MHTPWQLVLLFATGVFAGFVDSIAGGGGLITLPVLLSFGGDTRHILGANKLQATCGSASAAVHYAHAKQVDLRDTVRICAFTFIGACLGTGAVLRLDPLLVKRVIPVVLIAVVIYVLLKPDLGHIDSHPRMKRPAFDLLFGLGLGFYDGFIGPGVGSFWTVAFCYGRRVQHGQSDRIHEGSEPFEQCGFATHFPVHPKHLFRRWDSDGNWPNFRSPDWLTDGR